MTLFFLVGSDADGTAGELHAVSKSSHVVAEILRMFPLIAWIQTVLFRRS